MTPADPTAARRTWLFMVMAAAILMITMGARQSLGLFVSPLNTATGLGVVAISFAMAVGQFVWGAAQPIFGAVADRYGPGRVIVAGGLMMAAGMAITPFVQSEWALVLSLGVLAAAGAGAGSFAILIGATAQRLPPERRAFASGFINAGGSFGQFVFAPFAAAVIQAFGWVAAMLALAASSLATLPLAWGLRGKRTGSAGAAVGAAADAPSGGPARPDGPVASAARVASDAGLRAQLRTALRDRSYLLLHAGFFTCGFHIAFLVTHLPGEIALCGLPPTVAGTALALIGLFNIVGSLGVGWLAQTIRMKTLLVWMYASRAAVVALYLLAPKTPMTFYVFAAVLGLTWLATVPPTAGLVGKLFGTRYLATLFGLTLLSHQVGGFLGAWLGGLALDRLGDFTWMWIADIVLALAAALLNLPIREAKPRAAVVAA